MEKEKIIRGIYKITNKINNKIYIGESLDIHRRWKEHIDDLNNNQHHSYKLQKDWNMYGQDKFTFDVVEELEQDIDTFSAKYILVIYENKYIKFYNSLNEGYNCEDTLFEILSGNKKMMFNNNDHSVEIMKKNDK